MASFYEFFAGGGMARLGLGADWTCLFANDVDFRKALSYQAHFGAEALKVADIRQLSADDLPGFADLAWGSFPCQDLSLAGVGAGLTGERSGTFYPFWDLIRGLDAQARAPKVVALENVCGALTAQGGRDFEAICEAFAAAGYRCGALVIDAELFVPQSRPRLFVIGVRGELSIPSALLSPGPLEPFHTRGLRRAVERLPQSLHDDLLWWSLPPPGRRVRTLADEIEQRPTDVAWRSAADTGELLAMMSPLHRAKVDAAKRSGRRMVGGVYRRTRREDGRRVQRAEVRFDDVSGCLRTPAGGSSRQLLLVVDGQEVRSRLISARETARLMGLPEDYRLPASYNQAYHLTGDGVAVDVVRHLTRHLLEPLVGLADPALRLPASTRVVERS